MKRFNPNPCPEPGEGVHSWFLHAAHCAVKAGLTDEQAIEEITLLATREPRWNEIEDALNAARRRPCGSVPPWSRPNPGLIDRVTKGGPTVVNLIARSPRSSCQIDAYEQMLFAFFPELPRCVRAMTSVEPVAGSGHGCDAVSEQMLFAFFPELPRCVRAITSAEPVAGFGYGCDAVLNSFRDGDASTETIKRRHRSGLLHPLRLSQRSLLYKIEEIEALEKEAQ